MELINQKYRKITELEISHAIKKVGHNKLCALDCLKDCCINIIRRSLSAFKTILHIQRMDN